MSRVIKSERTEKSEEANRTIHIKTFQPSIQQSGVEEERVAPAAYFEADKQKILEEAQEAARSIIDQAERRCREMNKKLESDQQSWDIEKQSLREQAYEEGFSSGQQQGHEAGYKDYLTLIETAKETIECSKKEYELNVQRSEKLILDIAIKSAEKIIGEKLDASEQAFLTIVQQALKGMPDQKEIQIHVHPAKYPLVISQKEEIESMFPIDTLCYIYPNEGLAEEGCYIETNHGRIEVGLDSQLQELRKQLFELLEGEEM